MGVATATLRRGPRDTARAGAPPSVTLPLGLVVPNRVLAIALVVAAMLHVPFLPALFSFDLGNDLSVGDYEPSEAFLPIELDIAPPEDPVADEAAQAGDPGVGDPAAVPEVAPSPPIADSLDAGVDASPEEPPDAGEEIADAAAELPDAELPDAAPEEAPDAAVADAGPPAPERIKSPLDVAGASPDLSKHPNVQVLLVGKNMRSHPIGRTLGSVFAAIPEWKSFFDGTAVDPIQDFESLTIYGPQFRNSSEVVAVIHYGTEFDKMKGAVDHVVKKTKGEWLTGKPLRHVAKAKADRAQRLFAFVGQRQLLYILPLSLEDKLAALNAIPAPSTKTKAAIVVGLIDPYRPFGKAFPIPESIRWLGLTVNPTEEGGADVLLQLNDSSAADAALHAPQITRDFNNLRQQLKWEVGVGAFKVGFAVEDVLDEVEFVADDKVILARTQISREQLSKLITALNVWLSLLGSKK